jgi:hypothetical protein
LSREFQALRVQLADVPGLGQLVHVVVEAVHQLAHLGFAADALVMGKDVHGAVEYQNSLILRVEAPAGRIDPIFVMGMAPV